MLGDRPLSALVLLLATLILVAVPGAVAQSVAQNAAGDAAPQGFSVENGSYIAVAEALGADAAEAQEKARGAALGILFRGLGKDRLFAEVFVGSPPVGLVFDLLSSNPEGGDFRARVRLCVDDESIRIVERGPYLAAATSLLDEAEAQAAKAEESAVQGAAAESAAQLGEALVAYGMAEDSARSALALLEGLADASIFSTAGKRTAPELRRALDVGRDSAAAGVGRVRAAQAALEANETDRSVGESVRRAMEAADRAEALLSDSGELIGDPTAFGAERLSPLRDRLALERRSLSDAVADLKRAEEALPSERGYRDSELEFARRRLATTDEALERAYRSIDREIRDPAARRAARARAWRWVFLHAPSELLSFRAYLPFAFEPAESASVETAPFDFSVGAEGAFPIGGGGIWVRTHAWSATTDLPATSADIEEYVIRQSFDLGFWRRTLFFAGYGWDWYRAANGERIPKPGQVEVGIGGVSRVRGAEEGARKADWLLALSYELPYETEEFLLWNALNAGLEAQFRLGNLALLEASSSYRLHRSSSEGELFSVFRWSLGFGLRLPPPFLWGGEYFGTIAWPLDAGGSPGDAVYGRGGAFRFYLGYSF